MSYRRSRREAREEVRLARHREALIRLGVPPDVVADRRRWGYVLDHGDCIQGGWRVELLAEDDARELMALLQEIYPDEHLGLVDELRWHLERIG